MRFARISFEEVRFALTSLTSMSFVWLRLAPARFAPESSALVEVCYRKAIQICGLEAIAKA
jgi:hypothetical protein